MGNSFNLGNFNISYNNFIKYQNIVRSIILKSLYKDKIINDDGIDFVSNLPFDNPERIKSIINYASSNIYLCSSIVKDFGIKNEKELINFIYDNKNDLFLQDGKYFKYVLTKLIKTEAIGVKNEESAAKHLTYYIKNKLGQDIKVSRTDTDCRDDLLHGIDLFFYIKERKFTCQVKPLKSVSTLDDRYIIRSFGKIKKLKVDYLIFIDIVKDKFMLFQNKNVTLSGYNLIIDKGSLVKLD